MTEPKDPNPFESELPTLPSAPSYLANLRSLLASLPTPLPSGRASARTGASAPEPPDATTEMAQPLTPQPESFITTNPTTTKTNMLADPALESLSAWNGVTNLTKDGAWHDLTSFWQYAVVINSGSTSTLQFRMSQSVSREDPTNPYNSALLSINCSESAGETFDVDVYFAPSSVFDPALNDPTQDFLVAQAVAVARAAVDADVSVLTISLQLVKNPGVSEVVMDESPLFDVKAASVGDNQYLLAVISDAPWSQTYQWRLRVHIESAGTGTWGLVGWMLAGEPLLSFSQSPDPITYAPYVGRWTPAFLQNNFVRLDQRDSFSAKGVDLYSIPDSADAYIRFRLRDDASTGWYPRLAIGINASGDGQIAWGGGPTSAPDVAIERLAAGYLRLGDWTNSTIHGDITLDMHGYSTSYDPLVVFSVGSETYVRMSVGLIGAVPGLTMGSGAAAEDVAIYRDPTYGIVIDDNGATANGDSNRMNRFGELYIYRPSGAGNIILTDPTAFASSNVAFVLKNDGSMYWGPGSPTAREWKFSRVDGQRMRLETNYSGGGGLDLANTHSGNYSALRFLNDSYGARIILDYGTGSTDDMRILTATGTAGSETATERLRLTAAGVFIHANRTRWDGAISPPQITADQNNYNPTGLADANLIAISSDAARNITGLVAGTQGDMIWIVNGGSFTITLVRASGSSTAANRFYTPGAVNFALSSGAAALLVYSGTGWRVIG